MKTSHTLLLALAIALTLAVAACGSSAKTTTKTSGGSSSSQSSSGSGAGGSGSSGSGSGSASYPTAFVNAFTKGCDTNGGTKAYCECVIAYVESNVSYQTVLTSQKAISEGKKPTWYTAAIHGCLTKL